MGPTDRPQRDHRATMHGVFEMQSLKHIQILSLTPDRFPRLNQPDPCPLRRTGRGSLRRPTGSDINLGWLNTTVKNGFMRVSRRGSSRDARFTRLAFTRTVKGEDIDFY